MDYRAAVKQIIQGYARFKPAYGEINPGIVFDETNDRYQLLYIGWENVKGYLRRLSMSILSGTRFGSSAIIRKKESLTS